jgi:hypothetical protein
VRTCRFEAVDLLVEQRKRIFEERPLVAGGTGQSFIKAWAN